MSDYKLLETIVAEEQFYSSSTHRIFAFFSVFLSTITLATIAGATRAEGQADYLILLCGPVLIFFISVVANKSVETYIRRTLEIITIRAKIEQQLGMTAPRENEDLGHTYWEKEALISTSFIRSRESYSSSEEFVKDRTKKGLLKQYRVFFLLFQITAVLLVAALIFLSMSITQTT